MSRPKKYDHIDFRPPEQVARVAEEALELRRKFDRGGTSVGVARARDLKNRANLSPKTIERMHSYFARHAVDKRASDFDNMADMSAGGIAWRLWGGDPGREWAERIYAQMQEADAQA
jgi:muramoyltetrapeptide carboxypeptidase LdcA involved in peptidoglycan recycling